jgi:urease subunit gamma
LVLKVTKKQYTDHFGPTTGDKVRLGDTDLLIEIEKMMIWTAAQIAEGRKQKGVKLNYPESIAYIANFVVEGAREGKSVAELMTSARNILKRADVMEGVPEMIHTVQVEVTFPDGTKLVTVHDPVQ